MINKLENQDGFYQCCNDFSVYRFVAFEIVLKKDWIQCVPKTLCHKKWCFGLLLEHTEQVPPTVPHKQRVHHCHHPPVLLLLWLPAMNWGKLHFTTLNYALDYTLHHKLFECTVYTLNYDPCCTLHPDVNFTVKFNGNMKHVTCMCVLLK